MPHSPGSTAVIRPFPSLLLGTLLLGACSSSAQVAPRAPRTAVVVPDFEGSHWSFSASGYGHGQEGSRPLPAGAGEPLASATDLGTNWSAVAYRTHFAALVLFGGEVLWHPADFGDTVPALAIGDELLAAAAGDQVTLYELESGERLWSRSAANWLREVGGDRLVAAVPLSRERLVLVGSRAPSTFGADGAALLARVDGSRGEFATESNDALTSLTHVQAVANLGSTVFVAGIKEAYQQGVGQSRGRSFANLVIVRYDAQSGVSREVVRSLEHERGRALQELIVGRDPESGQELLAVLLEGGQMRAFAVLEQGTTSAPIFDLTRPGTSSIAWVSATALVAQGPQGSERYELR
jgi:hypothetical protein